MGLLVSCGLVGVANLFFFCYFGILATESFRGMADALYESNWSEVPVRLQKYFIIMVANTQKPVYYHGFGVAVLNLETFTRVSQAILKAVSSFIYFSNFSVLQGRSHILYGIQSNGIQIIQ